MSPTHVPEKISSAAPSGSAQSRVIVAANADDAMRDQLEYLIEHAQGGNCGCPQCHRYQRAKSILLEIFS